MDFKLELGYSEATFMIESLNVILRRLQDQIVRSKLMIKQTEKKLEEIRNKDEKRKNRSWRTISISNGETKETKYKRIINEEKTKISESRCSYDSAKTIYIELINQVWKDHPNLISRCIEENDNFKERESMFFIKEPYITKMHF